MLMEKDQNPMPEIVLFPVLDRIARVGRFIGTRLMLCDERPNTGAAPMLDRELYGQLEFDYGTDEQAL